MFYRDKHKGTTSSYTVISNQPINDKELSLEAKGLLLCILSLPNDWNFNINGLVTRFGLKKSCVIRVLKELETNGYITRYRKKNELNQFNGWGWDIYEKPNKEVFPKSGNTDVGKDQYREKLNSENAYVGKTRNQGKPNSGKAETRENQVSENANAEDSEIGKSVNITKTDNDIVLTEHITDNDQVFTQTNTDKKRSNEGEKKQKSGNPFTDLLVKEGFT